MKYALVLNPNKSANQTGEIITPEQLVFLRAEKLAGKSFDESRMILNEGLHCPECKNPVFIKSLPQLLTDFDLAGIEIGSQSPRINGIGFSHYGLRRTANSSLDECSLYNQFIGLFSGKKPKTVDPAISRYVWSILTSPKVKQTNRPVLEKLHFAAAKREMTADDCKRYINTAARISGYEALASYAELLPYIVVGAVASFKRPNDEIVTYKTDGVQYLPFIKMTGEKSVFRAPKNLALFSKKGKQWVPKKGFGNSFVVSKKAASILAGVPLDPPALYVEAETHVWESFAAPYKKQQLKKRKVHPSQLNLLGKGSPVFAPQ